MARQETARAARATACPELLEIGASDAMVSMPRGLGTE